MPCVYNANFAVFGMQFFMSFMGLTFTMVMIGAGKNIEVYAPVMTSIVAYWLPSPLQGWRLNTRPDLLLLGSQSLISTTTLVFSGTMLFFGGQTSVFLPIVTSIMAYWLPNPTFNQMSVRVDTSELDVSLLQNHV